MPSSNYLVTIGLASLVVLVLLLPFEVQGQSKESPGKYGHPNLGTITEYLQRDAGDIGKFDDGFYEHVLALQVDAAQGQAGWQRSADSNYHTVVIAVTKYDENGRDVSAENKNAVVDILEQAGARNIAVSETLSFITASVPVGNILELSWHGAVHRMGNGEALSLPTIDTMRATIGAMPDDLRRLDGTIVNGSGVKVGVIDSGINHPQGINDKVIGRAMCDGHTCRSTSAQSVIGSDPDNQRSSHGTNVALIIAGYGFSQNNGIAPGVGILNAIVQLRDVPIMHGISWTLGQGADVTNISLSANRCNGIDFDTTRQLVTGEAVESGMVLAVAAGNGGSRGTEENRTPVYKSINEWGCSHNVITVGGINDRDPDNVVMYAASSRGPGSHLVNGTIYPILKPEIVAPARSIETAGYMVCPSQCWPSGTSYAAPAVTAAAALVLDERHLEPAGVKAALLLGANWTGPVPCTSVQYEQKNATDDCSHERQPAGFAEANHDGSLGIINNVGFGILDAGAAVDYATRASGSHVVEGSLDSDDEVDEYRFRVTNTEEPVKVILTWTSDPYYDGPRGDKGENYFADLGFTVACPGMDVVSAQSDYQANEFAVFMPAQTGVCTVAVAGSGIDTPRRSQQDYFLAGTIPFDVDELLRPFPVLSPSEKSPTNAVNITFTVDFGAQMNADTFDSSDILASGGLVSTPAPVNGTSRAFTFEISDIPEGNLTVYMPEGAVLDQDGNSNTASDTHVIEIERVRPTSIISTAVSSPVNASSVTFTVDFGEPVDQATFTILDISVSGGTVSDPLPVDGTGMEFTFGVSDLAAGNLTVSIPEGGVLDPAGNNNTASNTYVVEITRPRPAPVISTTEPSRSNAHSIAFTVDFGVPVDQATFTASDISVSGGTVSGPLPVNGTARTFTFEVSDMAAGNLTVSIPEGGVLDPVGNNNTASDTHVIEIERIRPTSIISTAVSSPVNASSITFTVDFGEQVDRSTFDPSDVSVSGGTVSDPLPANGTAGTFTFEVSDLAAGNLTVSIPEGGVLDLAGNNNTASDQLTLTVTRISAGTTPDAAFVTTWQTTSANESILIPVGDATGTYTVTWGDASIDADVSGHQMHTYETAGTYTVSIYGDFSQIYLPYYYENSLKLQSIEQWGDIRWESMRGAFSGASNMVYRATDAPDLSAVTDTSEMFRFASSFNGNLSTWDVSSVTDASQMFAYARSFNGDMSSWNVSGMTDMSKMLKGTHSAIRNLGDWYVVLDDTIMSEASETLVISAQNAYLDGQNPTYVVNDARFAVADGALAVKPGRSAPPGTYNVTVTVGGVIGEHRDTLHSRTIQVTVEGDAAPPTILSAAYLTGNGTLTVTFSEPLNGTIHYDRLHVRDAGQSSGGISLDEAQVKQSSGPAVTVLLAAQQRADFARMAAPQLDVGQGAVSDITGNEVAAVVDQPVDAVAAVAGSGAFVTTWTVGAGDSITIPVGGSAATYDIDWGDGTVETGVVGDRTHTYDAGGNYTVLISDDFERIHLNGHPAASKLASIDQWGDVQWTSMESAFAGASNMVYGATDTPDLSAVTDTSEMLKSATSFNGDISAWDVSKVTDMGGMFNGATSFNGDISDWDTSSVASMESMFRGATSFNGDISDWDVSGIANMTGMFANADSFAQNLGAWYVVLDGDTLSGSADSIGISAQNQVLDGQNPTYTIDGAAPNGDKFWIVNGSHLAIRTDQAVAQGQYNVTIKSTGSFGVGNSGVAEITVSEDVVLQTNNPPSVEAGHDQTAGEGTTVVLAGSATDLDGDALTYLWTHDPASLDIALANATSPSTTFTAPLVNATTTVTFTLTADDGTVASSDSVSVTITHNNPPSVEAGPAQTIPEGSEASLNGSATDLDGDALTYLWTHDPASLDIALANATSPSTTFTAPLVNATTTVTFTLTADDGTVASSDSVSVTITHNNPPSVEAGPAQTIPEGSEASLNGSATDLDGDALTYLWTHDPASLDIALANATSPSTTFTAPLVNATTTVTFTLTADDGTAAHSDAVTVTILDVPASDTQTVISEQASSVVLEPEEPRGTRDIGRMILNSTLPGTIDAGWEAPAEAPADYRISWAKAGESFRVWTDLSGNAFPTDAFHTITDLEEGEEYKVVVRARYDGTSGDWSGEAAITAARATATAVTPDNSTVPGAPRDLAVSRGDSGALAVSWQAPSSDGGSALTGYAVQWKEADSSWDVPADVSEETTAATTHTVTGLANGVSYTVRVLATNQAGSGSPSAEETGTPLASRDIAGLTLNSTTPGTILAFWDVPNEAPADYRISWAKAGESFRTWTDLSGNAFPTDASHTITNLEEGEEYKVVVRARYDGTSGDWSSEVAVTVAGTG